MINLIVVNSDLMFLLHEYQFSTHDINKSEKDKDMKLGREFWPVITKLSMI
jgi:hypothetical protein